MAFPTVIKESDVIIGSQMEMFGLKPRTANRRFIVQVCERFSGSALTQAFLDAVPEDPTRTSSMPFPGETHPSFRELRAVSYNIQGIDVNLVQIDVGYLNFEDFFISGNVGLALIDWYNHIISDTGETIIKTDENGVETVIDNNSPGSPIAVAYNPDDPTSRENLQIQGANIHRFLPEGTVTLQGAQMINPIASFQHYGKVNAEPFLITKNFPGFPPGTLMLENISFDSENSASFQWWNVRYTFRFRAGGWYETVVWRDKQNNPAAKPIIGLGVKKVGMAEIVSFTAPIPLGLQLPAIYFI